MRRCEVAALKMCDVDVSRNLIVIRSSKGNKTRHVPVRRELAETLVVLAPEPEGTLFRSRAGGALSARQVNRIVAQAGVRAGVSNPNPKYTSVTCHLLRHSFARHWKRVRGSVESLSKILGHASVKTTWDLYGTESLTDVQRNYEVTLRRLFPQQQSGTALSVAHSHTTADLRKNHKEQDGVQPSTQKQKQTTKEVE